MLHRNGRRANFADGRGIVWRIKERRARKQGRWTICRRALWNCIVNRIDVIGVIAASPGRDGGYTNYPAGKESFANSLEVRYSKEVIDAVEFLFETRFRRKIFRGKFQICALANKKFCAASVVSIEMSLLLHLLGELFFFFFVFFFFFFFSFGKLRQGRNCVELEKLRWINGRTLWKAQFCLRTLFGRFASMQWSFLQGSILSFLRFYCRLTWRMPYSTFSNM